MSTQIRNSPKISDGGWRVYQSKCCVSNKEYQDNSPSNANDVNNVMITFVSKF